ncbi:MAG: type I 3-dehydroquinate dehydratase [Lachnospiraceae bacterium]|jgi:3-dehydroquinate dehydratase-1|nr:type I 3-dehydroquinate dehydratase [Lachnospiraceae bacterium]
MIPLTIKNKTFSGKNPKICIPITGRTEKEILETAKRIRLLPADVTEWRADYYEAVTDREAVRHILDSLKSLLPDSLLLFTFRTQKEGGVRPLSDKDYLELGRTAAASGLIDLLDLELFTGTNHVSGPKRALLTPLISLAHEWGCHVILSSHDFDQTPPEDELLRRLSLMESMEADLAKIAVMPQSETDVLALLSATRKAADTLSCPVITMSMGALGVISRISGKLTGSCLTFGTAGEASAPGQLPAKILKKILEAL